MSDEIICPKCGHEHSINDMELWEVYEEDGKETELDCHNCSADLVVTSVITGWSFDTELNDQVYNPKLNGEER